MDQLGKQISSMERQIADMTDALDAARAEALAWRRFAEWHPVSEKPDGYPCKIEYASVLSGGGIDIWANSEDSVDEFDFTIHNGDCIAWRYFNAPKGQNE